MPQHKSTKTVFPLPDDWEPEGIVCVTVPVPDDAQYIAALVGLLDLLKNSRSFARDATATGAATVSRTWQAALDSVPIKIGDCESMILRQNPDDPCQLQQSHDGGDTWTLAFDYSICSTVITVPAPYPGSETGASDAAAAAVRNILEALVNMVDCEQTRQQYIDAATAYMRTFDAAYANPIALGQIYDAACAMSPEELEDYQNDCAYEDHKDELEACANVEGLYDWLNCLAAQLFEWLNDTGSDLMNALNAAAAALSGNGWQRASEGGSGGGADFGATCEWEWFVDFTESDGGFEAVPGVCETGYATYSPGVGWQGVFNCEGGGEGYTACRIRKDFDEAFITYQAFTETHSGGDVDVEQNACCANPTEPNTTNDNARLDVQSHLQLLPFSINITSFTIRGTGPRPVQLGG